jgi:hypothetical protein
VQAQRFFVVDAAQSVELVENAANEVFADGKLESWRRRSPFLAVSREKRSTVPAFGQRRRHIDVIALSGSKTKLRLAVRSADEQRPDEPGDRLSLNNAPGDRPSGIRRAAGIHRRSGRFFGI